MSTKIVPVMSEEEAATKMQAMQRGNNARADAATKDKPGGPMKKKPSMEKKLTQKFEVPGADPTLPKQKSWGLVRQKTGIKFDSWDVALSVIDAGWRGELQREVLRKVEAQIPDNPWGKVFLVFLAYWAGFFLMRSYDLGFPDSPTLKKGTSVVLIWTCSTLGGKLMGKVGMPGLLGNLLSGICVVSDSKP